MDNKLENILKSLYEEKSSNDVFNQYEKDKVLVNNLRLYFRYLQKNKSKIMLIGEAPGYKGCKLTGIPFTSGAIIRVANHKIFKEIGYEIREPIISEISAKILWDYLDYDKPVPILWNAFPFHPHKSNECNSNRKPSKDEIEKGKYYLQKVCELFNPTKFFSLGRVGEKIFKEVFPDKNIEYIRHPAYGGKQKFLEGMQKLNL